MKHSQDRLKAMWREALRDKFANDLKREFFLGYLVSQASEESLKKVKSQSGRTTN